MQPRVWILAALAALSVAACKRSERRAEQAPIAAAVPPMMAAPPPGMPAPVAPVALPPAVQAPPVVSDPLWPQWLPVIPGVRRRLNTSSVFGGVADQNVLMVLVRVRQTLQTQGYTLSQTDVRRQPWEDRFVFSATRGDEFLRMELVGRTANPASTEVGATTGAVARAMMRRRR